MMLRKIRWQGILKFTGCVFLLYAIKLLAYVTLTGQHDTSPPIRYHNLELPNDDISPSCDQKTLDIATIALGAESCRHFSHMLKVYLQFRQNATNLHIVTDSVGEPILHTLLTTWTLPQVSWNFIRVENLLLSNTHLTHDLAFLIAALPSIVRNHTQKIIYLSTSMRLMGDPNELWDHFDNFGRYQAYGIADNAYYTQDQKTTQTDATDPPIILYDVAAIKMQSLSFDVSTLEKLYNSKNHSSTKSLLRSYTNSAGPYILPCPWTVSFMQSFDVQACLKNRSIKGVIWSSQVDKFSNNLAIEKDKELLTSILASDGEVYRHRKVYGKTCTSPQVTPTTPPKVKDKPDACAEFRHATQLSKRTHINFIAPNSHPKPQKDGKEVSLLTQMTLDRLGTFEKMMSSWPGSASVVIHTTDAEALTVEQKIEQSGILKKRTNIAYHLVYKRGKFYPINYLRNVALNASWTPYIIFIDVDLVPNQDIYPMLQSYISSNMEPANNVTLVVPAFGALEPVDNVPADKPALLRLINDKKAEGYRMSRGWNLGHKPTNYPHWMEATQPYKIIWKDAFEPYVVLRRETAPQYRDELLERMGDKIAYGRELHARGYEFMGLPDVFILHLPHPVSEGTQTWKSYKGYGRCSGIIFNEYRRELAAKHPDIHF